MKPIQLLTLFVISIIFCPWAAGQQLIYSDTSSWWAHPKIQDYGDYDPVSGSYVKEDTSRVDVFYIHPTTYYRGTKYNYQWSSPSTKRLTPIVLLNQASVFNESCRIYAPKYRQVRFDLMLSTNLSRRLPALDTAYADIVLAFENYLSKWNSDRPLIIAAHSQGSYLAQRLIHDYFQDSVLRSKLVAAYIPGYPIAAKSLNSTFHNTPVCTDSAQTGCLIGWQTVGEKIGEDYLRERVAIYIDGDHIFSNDEELISVNPLSWDTTSTRIPASENPGSLKSTTRIKRIKPLAPEVCDAQVLNGFVIVSDLNDRSYNSTGQNYHIHDYGLFYLSIRQNVATRIDSYFKSQ